MRRTPRSFSSHPETQSGCSKEYQTDYWLQTAGLPVQARPYPRETPVQHLCVHNAFRIKSRGLHSKTPAISGPMNILKKGVKVNVARTYGLYVAMQTPPVHIAPVVVVYMVMPDMPLLPEPRIILPVQQ